MSVGVALEVRERGGLPGLLDRWRASRGTGTATVLAVVTSTRGSTYRKPGAMALLDASGILFGALSGGCLEPELERRARRVLDSGRAERAGFDTEPDADRVFGSGLGCRGRLEVILLPIPADSTAHVLVALERAFAEREALHLTLSLDGATLGAGTANAAGRRSAWRPDGRPLEGGVDPVFRDTAVLQIPAPRALLVLGAGPETAALLAFARWLGWTATVVEHRERWAEPTRVAVTEEVHDLSPAAAFAALSARRFDAVLVTSHSFETDVEHLRAWLGSRVPYIGLLGPSARRDELLRELGVRPEELEGRLQAPIGLPLGGDGPEAIALSIVAQLQRHFADASG